MDSYELFINEEEFLSIGANRHQDDHPYVGYCLRRGLSVMARSVIRSAFALRWQKDVLAEKSNIH